MPASLQTLVQQAAVMAVLGGGGLALLWWLKRRPAPPAGRRARPEGTVRALGELLEELRRTGTWMTDQTDRRMEELRRLLAEADERIRRLEALEGRGPELPGGGRPGTSGTRPRPPEDEVPEELKAVFDTVYGKADHGIPVADIARDTGLNKGAVNLILALRKAQGLPDGTSPGAPR